MKRLVIFACLACFPVVSYADNIPVTNKKVAKAYVGKIRKLQAHAKKMKKLRESGNAEDHYQCMGKMRAFKPQIAQLEQEGENFPMTSANVSFRAAVTDLKMCLVCSDIANQYCPMVESSIQEGYRFLKEE